MSPRRPAPVEGRDYYCGECAGHDRVPCPWCDGFGGCSFCRGQGTVPCESCQGGTVPVRPPDWL